MIYAMRFAIEDEAGKVGHCTLHVEDKLWGDVLFLKPTVKRKITSFAAGAVGARCNSIEVKVYKRLTDAKHYMSDPDDSIPSLEIDWLTEAEVTEWLTKV